MRSGKKVITRLLPGLLCLTVMLLVGCGTPTPPINTTPTPLPSHDIAYSMDRALQPATRSAAAGYYMRYIKDAVKLNTGRIPTIIGDSILTPDDDTVVIIASQNIPFFLKTLTYATSFVVE